MGGTPAGPRPRLREAGLRRLRLVFDRRAELRRALGLRRTRLRQLDVSARHRVAARPRPRHEKARLQSRLELPHDLHRAGELEGPPGHPALRRRLLRLLRLGQRPQGRLRRGLEAAFGIRHHAVSQSNYQLPIANYQLSRGGGVQVVRRQLLRGPGHDAVLRNLPRRHALGDAEGRDLGLCGEDDGGRAHRGGNPGRVEVEGRRRTADFRIPLRCGQEKSGSPPMFDFDFNLRLGRQRRPPLVRREALPLHARHQEGRRHPDEARRIQGAEDRREHLLREREGDQAEGRQPPRDESRGRAHGDARGDGARRPAHEAAQHRHRPDVPLSRPPSLVRPLRQVRNLRRRGGERREPRALPVREDAGGRSDVRPHDRRAQRATGPLLPQPPIRHDLVDGQRDRARRLLSPCDRRGEEARSVASGALGVRQHGRGH